MKKLIRISASDYTPHLIKVSPTDKKYILDKLNKSHKTLGDLGSAGDPGYYISEFEPAYGLYLWASDTGLRILDDNGIEYTEVKKAVGASTKVTASQHWREKTECKTKNGKITRMQNISGIFNDVDYYILYDANGKFVEKSIDFNYLHDKLYDVGKDDSQPSSAAKFLKGHPLSIADVEGLWDILPMYVDFGDSDALLQENGYTLDQASEFLRQGYSIYVDASTKVSASDNPFYDKLSDYNKRVVDSQLRSKYPYQIVSMAAILRDHIDFVDKAYKDATHKKLTDIADSLYNVGLDPAEMYPEYSQLYARMGKEYFDKVLDDMYAIDGQLTSDAKVQELIDDYYDRIGNIIASTKVTAATNSTGEITGPYNTSLHYDLWYGDEFVPKKYGADAFVSGNGEYRGNIFDDTGATIGDYSTDNSVLIEKNFLIDFGG